MRANLTTRDYEMLSAYIDGQLAPGDQRKLEERLHARPELQAALDELQRTRALLRQAPRRRAPRNFTLTPAMVGEQRRKPAPWAGWFPALSFTSALAALALVVTIVLQFAPPGATPTTIAMQQAPAAEMEAAAPEMRTMEEPAAPGAGAAQPQATQAAESAAAGAAAAGTAPDEESARALESTPTAGPAVLPEYEATAQAFGEATLAPDAPGAAAETPAAEATPPAREDGVPTEALSGQDMAATAPPVIQWNNPSVPPGMGGAGGMGGGGGEGPSLGPLMGPPPSPEANGMGGGAPDGSVTLPPEAMSKEAPVPSETPAPGSTPESASEAGPEALAMATPEATTQSDPLGTPVAAVPADASSANNSGPILGVPAAGEGGQVMEKKAIMGDTDAYDGSPAPADTVKPLVGEQPRRSLLGLEPWALTTIQVALALLAIAAGVAAYLYRLKRR